MVKLLLANCFQFYISPFGSDSRKSGLISKILSVFYTTSYFHPLLKIVPPLIVLAI
jgi:hypothetical protein